MKLGGIRCGITRQQIDQENGSGGLGRRLKQVRDDHQLDAQMTSDISTQFGQKRHKIGRCGGNHGRPSPAVDKCLG